MSLSFGFVFGGFLWGERLIVGGIVVGFVGVVGVVRFIGGFGVIKFTVSFANYFMFDNFIGDFIPANFMFDNFIGYFANFALENFNR